MRMPREGRNVRKQPLGSSGYAKDEWKPVDYTSTTKMRKGVVHTEYAVIVWEMTLGMSDHEVTTRVRWIAQDNNAGDDQDWDSDVVVDDIEGPWRIEVFERYVSKDVAKSGAFVTCHINESFESDRAFTIAEAIAHSIEHWPTTSAGHPQWKEEE